MDSGYTFIVTTSYDQLYDTSVMTIIVPLDKITLLIGI